MVKFLRFAGFAQQAPWFVSKWPKKDIFWIYMVHDDDDDDDDGDDDDDVVKEESFKKCQQWKL